jgi:Ca-activated chloride channel family protein
MQRLWLTGQILAAGARLVVRHVFESAEERPLEVIYSFVLPRDAAMRGFRITGDGFEAHSELKQTEEAVKAYEEGILDGSLSSLARLYGDGIVNLTVGNVRPGETVTVYLELLCGVELRDDGFRFRFPFTLAPAYHSRMRVARVGDEGEMELPGDEFGDVILPRFRRDASTLHEVGFELSVLHHGSLGEIGSPSHSIKLKHENSQSTRIALAHEKDVPNRDLVFDVRLRQPEVQVLSGSDRGKRAFAAIVPSSLFGERPRTPRRAVILLDRSGSMGGTPIAQARKAVEACLAALCDEDLFGLAAFDDSVETMRPSLVPATGEHRQHAREFLKRVDARGGTELAKGFQKAAQVLGGSGDVLVVTDGQVFGTERILAQARSLGIRIFCLGIGSASQDRFLALLARETAAVSRFVTPGERVDLTAVDVFASMGQPIASGLKSNTPIEPALPSSVIAGTPVVLFGELDDNPDSSVELTWEDGRLTFDVPSGDRTTGETVRLLRGSRMIADWESRYPAEEATAALDKRKQSRIAARLAELSRTYGLASREMSLVAVVKRAGDRPGELPETRVVPVGMPAGTSFDAYFAQPQRADRAMLASPAVMSAPTAASDVFELFATSSSLRTPAARAPEDNLMDLAAMLESDGGMPGKTAEERAARTVAAVLALVGAGHTLTHGAFRLHLQRLIAFLKSVKPASKREELLIDRAIDAASTGNAPSGDWTALATRRGTRWKHLI